MQNRAQVQGQLEHWPINQEKSVVLRADVPLGQSESGLCVAKRANTENRESLLYCVEASSVNKELMA